LEAFLFTRLFFLLFFGSAKEAGVRFGCFLLQPLLQLCGPNLKEGQVKVRFKKGITHLAISCLMALFCGSTLAAACKLFNASPYSFNPT